MTRVVPAPSLAPVLQSPSETPSEDPAVFHPQLHQASPSSPHCSSPAHSIPSYPHTPRCSPAAAIPRRLNYTNTTLYSDWSSSSPVPFTPSSGPSQWSRQSRATPSPSLSYGTGWQTPLRPSPASEMDWCSPLRQLNSGEMDWLSPLPSLPSPEVYWQRPSQPQPHKEWRSPLQRTQMTSPQNGEPIYNMLQRLERKVDHLTELLEISKPSPMPHNYSSTVRDLHHQFLPPSTEDNNNFNLEEEEVSSDDPLRPQSLVTIKAQSSSSMNFAVRLLRAFFTRPELKGKNVSGMRGKEQLDPEQITKIKNFVYEFYPTPPSERELVWRECRKAIDSYLRKAFPRSS